MFGSESFAIAVLSGAIRLASAQSRSERRRELELPENLRHLPEVGDAGHASCL